MPGADACNAPRRANTTAPREPRERFEAATTEREAPQADTLRAFHGWLDVWRKKNGCPRDEVERRHDGHEGPCSKAPMRRGKPPLPPDPQERDDCRHDWEEISALRSHPQNPEVIR